MARIDLSTSVEQDQLVDAFSSLYSKHSTPERVRAAEPVGFDAALWAQLGGLGTTAMAVGEEHGGWGATVLDLALIAEQQGRFVAPAPVVETQVAARLLAAAGPPGADVLAAVLAGERLVTLALHPVGRDGRAGLVPAGAVADAAIVLVEDRLLLVPLSDAVRTTVENLGSMPLADIDVRSALSGASDGPEGPGGSRSGGVAPTTASDGGDAGKPAVGPAGVAPHAAGVRTAAASTGDVGGGVVELASGADAAALLDAAIDDWLVLTAAALVGIGARALELGVEYVKERKAWGVPIGSFQAVAHPLADAATAVDGSRVLAYKAAWAADEQPERAGELAAMAFAHAAGAARDATYRSLHFHGGYGFMMEYDVQLLYRRARAWANVWGEPAAAYRRVADKRYGPIGSDGGDR
jgi:alkylation response protein AidB-like acyl-CoA dehydrogenase